MADDSQLDGQGHPSSCHDIGDQEYDPHAHQLLRHLRKSGDFCFLHAVIIAIDTGVDGRTGDRQGDIGQQGSAALLHEDPGGQKISGPPDQDSEKNRDRKGGRCAGQKNSPALFHVCRYALGHCRLDGSGAESETDPEDRMYHIVKSQTFCADGPGQIDPIEKT